MDKFKKDPFPFSEEEIGDMLDTFQNFMRYSRYTQEYEWKPALDIFEAEDKTIVLIEVAGVSEKDLDVSYKNGYLKVSGIRESEELKKATKIGHLEIEYGRFERVIKLSDRADVDNINVTLKNGILKIVVPVKNIKKKIDIDIE
ncbi:MAG: Hsp20/alpha crystallin family protein [Candidatus Schekmanbacteria bacterium]|nr:MAG: Hsp20/alpha crystallin family protein [Candidatus Schekmanbacteria bacterium]